MTNSGIDVFQAIVDGHRNRGLGNGQLDAVIKKIRDDGWNGSGPGHYVLPGVRNIHVERGGASLPLLYVNGKEVGQLHAGSDGMARALGAMVTVRPRDIVVDGHYGNTIFYIDSIGEQEMSLTDIATPDAPAGIDTLDAQQCEKMAEELMSRAKALRAMQNTAPKTTPEPPPAAPAPATAPAHIEHGDGIIRIGNVALPVRK